MKKIKVGLIGSGEISETYLRNMTQRYNILEVVGCSDIIPERSAERAKQFNIRNMTNEEIYNDKDIQIVVNTTYPTSHYEVTKAALLAGKHVFCEKMMAVELHEGKELVQIAKDKNLRLGMAPDTFLGAGGQTARKLIDSGLIGEPYMAVAMCVRGYHQERWPFTMYEFTRQPGGGIPFDIGGYYLHALINLLGPVSRATGFAQSRNPDRVVQNTNHPRFGQECKVDTINAMVGSVEFANGVLGSLTFVSEGFVETPRIEIYGKEGILIVPDPNIFGGQVLLRRSGSNDFMPMPHTHGFGENCCRSLGVADMAWAIVNNRPHRAHGDIGYHAFEVIHGIWECSRANKVHFMESTCAQPAPLASGYVEAGMDEYSLAL